MTAAHCVLPERENMTYQEHNASGNKPRVPVQTLATGTNIPDDTGANDWAILLLATPSTQQPFPIGSTTYINPLNQSAWLVGYSYDLDGLSVANNCTIKSINQGELSHDCDLKPGASGGPLYIRGDNDLRILVGIQSGGMDGKAETYRVRDRNNAAGVDGFIDRLAELVAIYP